MTVSRVVRGVPGVADETRRRVLAEAEACGYRQNPMVTAWMNHVRSQKKPSFQAVLAYCIFRPRNAESERHLQTRAYFPSAQIAAESRGFRFDPFWLADRRLTPQRIADIFAARGITGLLFDTVGAGMRLQWPEELWNNFTVVATNYSLKNPPVDRVCFNHFQGMLALIRNLRQHGYRRVGTVLTVRADTNANHLWSGAFASRFAGNGLRYEIPMLLRRHLSKEKTFRWLDEVKPDVVIGAEDLVAEWLDDYHDQRKKNIKFAHLDGDFSTHPRTMVAVQQKSERIGATAANLLMDAVNNNRRGIPRWARTVLVDGIVVWRG